MEEIINHGKVSIPNTKFREKKIDNSKKSELASKLTNKLFIQLFFCVILLIIICIYKLCFATQFDNVSKQYKGILKYNMNKNHVYNNVVKYINNKLSFNIPLKEENIFVKDINTANEKETVNETVKENSVAVSTSYNNMQLMASEIKQKYTLINPTSGIVSCPFGNRDPSNKDISSFHLGTDIANDKGTNIISALDGIVLESKYNSTYGNYLKIGKDDIIIIYAHCSKIMVKEGQNIKQGELIALMGETGLATGPHLHLEIRKNNMVINPEYILNLR